MRDKFVIIRLKMNIQKIVSLIKRENEEEKRLIRDRVTLAEKELERLKREFLKIDKDMERMICFGSLVRNNIESIRFDIDIAVKSKKYYQLVSKAMESEFEVDVIDLDSVHYKIRENIIKFGRIIYEKR